MAFQAAWLEFFYFTILLLVGLTTGQTISTAAPSTSNSSLCSGSMTCISDGNGSQVTFSAIPGTNQVLIDMTTTAIRSSGWLGLGFSYDTMMGNDSVIDCILLNNGTVIVKHSFNGDHVNNDIPNATEGISNANLSSSNGVVQCLFQRQINGLMNTQIYSLDKPYYLLLAHGLVDSQGKKIYHDGRYVTPQVMTVANSSNSSTPMWGYFSDSYGNRAAFKYLNSTNEMQFEITGPVAGPGRWIALGFSNDNLMGNDSVLDCILLSNGTVMVQLSFNEITRTNTPISSAGITLIGTSYQNGSLNCSFKRNATGYADQRIFPLDKPYYLLLAKGPVGMDGTKSHHDALPTKSSSAVDPHWAGNVTRETPVEMTTASTPSNSTNPSNSSSTLSGWSSFSDPQSSDSVQFKVSSDGLYVEFTIQRPSPPGGSGWVAVGFNESPAMKNSSVIDCILMPNGSFKTQLSYNEPVGAVNDELGNPDSAIINITNQNVDGMMKCNLKRKISGFNDSRIFPFTKMYYLLLASGPLNPDGTKQYHMNKVPSQNTFNLTSSMVQNSSNPSISVTPPNPVTPSNFSTPSGWSSFNNPQSSDNVQFKVSSDGLYVEFTIQRSSPPSGSGWVAVGFNESPAMKNSSVIDCILMPDGSFKTQLSYNEPVGAVNDELGNPDSAIVNVTNMNMDGIMKCNLKRKVSGFTDNRIFPFTKMYYLLLSSGPLNADGTKQYHTNRVPSQNTFNLTSTVGQNSPNTSNPVTPSNSTTPSNSSTLSGWSSFNDPQSSNSVQFKVSSDGLYVEFTIQRPSPSSGSGWVAVGFNEKPFMINSSVIDCILMFNGSFKTQLSYNEPVGAFNDELGNPDSAIVNVTCTNMDGIMKCNLKRKVSGFNDSRIFPFTKLYYLLLASGPLNADGTKQYHTNKVPSPLAFNLTSTEGQNGSQEGRRHSNAPDPVRLLRAHAVLMLTTFVMLMSGAIILARYYKTCWPEDKICGTGVWFAVHRFLMVLGLFCCAAGFILIFCYSDGFLFRGFPTGSPSYYWVHGPLGIVVMCLIVINPIMAIFRCDPDHSSRWIYNWLHFFVGMSCQILAGITLFFGIKMGEQYYNLNHWSVFWILIAFVGFHVFIEFILLIEKLITQRFTKQSFTVTYGMSGPGEEPTAVKTGAGMATRESLVFRYCVLTLYTTVTMGLWLAMIILIGGGFYTTKSS